MSSFSKKLRHLFADANAVLHGLPTSNKALLNAISNNDADGVKDALENGANANCFHVHDTDDSWCGGALNALKTPALILAIEKHAGVEIIRELLAHGADTAICKDRLYRTTNEVWVESDPALLSAVKLGDKDILAEVLQASSAINLSPHEWTELFKETAYMKAGLQNQKEIFELILSHPQAKNAFQENGKEAIESLKTSRSSEDYTAFMEEKLKELPSRHNPDLKNPPAGP